MHGKHTTNVTGFDVSFIEIAQAIKKDNSHLERTIVRQLEQTKDEKIKFLEKPTNPLKKNPFQRHKEEEEAKKRNKKMRMPNFFQFLQVHLKGMNKDQINLKSF